VQRLNYSNIAVFPALLVNLYFSEDSMQKPSKRGVLPKLIKGFLAAELGTTSSRLSPILNRFLASTLLGVIVLGKRYRISCGCTYSILGGV
jgi:hypothetical protein